MKNVVRFEENPSYATMTILRVPLGAYSAEMHMRAYPKPGDAKDPMSFFDEKEVKVHLPPTYNNPVPLYVVDGSGQPLPWHTPISDRPEATYAEVLNNAMRYGVKVVLDVRETAETVVQLVGTVLAVGNVVIIEDEQKSVTAVPVRSLAYVTEFEHTPAAESPLWNANKQQRVVSIRGRGTSSISAAFMSEVRTHSLQTLPVELLKTMWSGNSQLISVVRSLRLENTAPFKLDFDEVHLEMEPRTHGHRHYGGMHRETMARSLVATRAAPEAEEEEAAPSAANDVFVDVIKQPVSIDTMTVMNTVPREAKAHVMGIAVVQRNFGVGLYMNIISKDMVAPGRLDFGMPSMAYTTLPHVLKAYKSGEAPKESTEEVYGLSELPVEVKHDVAKVRDTRVVSRSKDSEKILTTDFNRCTITARQDVHIVISPLVFIPSFGKLVAIKDITLAKEGQEWQTIKSPKDYRTSKGARISIMREELASSVGLEMKAVGVDNLWFDQKLKEGEKLVFSFTREVESIEPKLIVN